MACGLLYWIDRFLIHFHSLHVVCPAPPARAADSPSRHTLRAIATLPLPLRQLSKAEVTSLPPWHGVLRPKLLHTPLRRRRLRIVPKSEFRHDARNQELDLRHGERLAQAQTRAVAKRHVARLHGPHGCFVCLQPAVRPVRVGVWEHVWPVVYRQR